MSGPDGEVRNRVPSRLATVEPQISGSARRALARLVAVHGVEGAAYRLRVGESTIEIVDGGGPVRRDTAERLQAALMADRCGCLGCALSLSVDAARAKNAKDGGTDGND